MSEKIVWGIIGLGHIAHKFASDINESPNSILGGVASRSLSKAIDFSDKYGALKYYDSYEALVEDPDISIVYIATPHSFHLEHTILALEAGKSVLCEKPLGLNSYEAKTMISEAIKRNLFLMEGIWTRFIPMTQKVLNLINDNRIGEVKLIKADFGFIANPDPEGRMYNKSLGGGSLLDIGIYPIYLSLLLLGVPENIRVKYTLSDSGIDTSCELEFEYDNGVKAILESNILKDTPTEAIINGENGSIKIHKRFHHSEDVTITNDDKTEDINLEYTGIGYYHEILEVEKCLNSGCIESELLPHSISLDLISIIDRIKNKMGLTYNSNCRM